jgi:hypothetical protein
MKSNNFDIRSAKGAEESAPYVSRSNDEDAFAHGATLSAGAAWAVTFLSKSCSVRAPRVSSSAF